MTSLPTLNPDAPVVFHSCDPGVKYYACACWSFHALTHVCIVPIDERPPFGQNGLVVIEVPQIYDARAGGTGARARKKDVADTLFAAGRIADRYTKHVTVTPAQWKGQLTKAQDHERTRAALTADELLCIQGLKKADLGHIMDAIGIGLKFLWRR